MVHQLQGKLLLTVGEMDKNVDPASTMQVVNALIKANEDATISSSATYTESNHHL